MTTGKGRGGGYSCAAKIRMSSADWNQFRRLMVYLRPHIGRFTIAMIAIVIGSVLGLAGPYTLQYLIDAVFTQNNAQLLNQITVILIIIFALQAVFYFIRAYQLQYIGERVMIDLRLNLFQHLQKLSLSFYNERRTGELVSRATNDVSTVRTLVTSDVSTAISQVITFFGALILILITDWRLTLVHAGAGAAGRHRGAVLRAALAQNLQRGAGSTGRCHDRAGRSRSAGCAWCSRSRAKTTRSGAIAAASSGRLRWR